MTKYSDNLYQGLDDDSFNEFSAGRGKELEGHMRALHSSSALAVNFFLWWRMSKNVPSLAKALGYQPLYYRLEFEKTHKKPEGIGGIRPHLDVELRGVLNSVAIEAKFTEPYQRIRKSLKSAYIENDIWGSYKGCKKLAQAIVSEKEVFEYLDAPQLLKHILGLKTDYKEKGFELIYLWYDYPSEEAENHIKEMKVFDKYVDGEVNIRDMTYQNLFDAVKDIPDIDDNYIGYLGKRYFPEEIFPPRKKNFYDEVVEAETKFGCSGD